jgi:CHAT domain-containing protein/tetratricopeptide (TPR) repeat protein
MTPRAIATFIMCVAVVAGLGGGHRSLAAESSWQEVLARADSLRKIAQYDSALDLAKQALEIAEKKYDAEDTSAARALWLIGVVEFNLGHYAETETACRRSESIFKKVLGPDHVEVARCLNTLANALLAAGHRDDVEALFKRALDIRERALGPEHPDVGMSLINLANYYWKQGRIPEAVPLCERALKIQEKAWGPDHLNVAMYLNNLANLYCMQGRYLDAEPLHRRALAIREKYLGSNHPDIAMSLGGLSNALYDQGRYAEAEPLTQRAVEINEAILGPNHPDLALYLNNLANIYSAEGRYVEAEPLMQRALRIREEALGSQHPDVALNLACLGDLYNSQGDYAQANLYFQRSQEIFERMVSPEHPYLASCLSGWAFAAAAGGHYGIAQQREMRAWTIRRHNFHDGAGVMAERNALEYSAALTAETANYLSILCVMPDVAGTNGDTIAHVMMASKSVVSDAIMTRHGVVQIESDPLIAAVSDSLMQARFAISTLYTNGLAEEYSTTYRDCVSVAVCQKERLERELARLSAGFAREQRLWDVSAATIASALPTGAVLVEFMRYRHRVDVNTNELRYLACVLRDDGRPQVFPLGPAAAIDTAVWNYRQQFRNSQGLDKVTYASASDYLYGQVWRPFAILVEGASTVFIAPDGNLNLVSFAGLIADDGTYLIEKYPIHYLSTGRDLIRLRDRTASGTGLLAMGAPNFDLSTSAEAPPVAAIAGALLSVFNLRSSCQAFSELHVSPLPETQAEVASVSSQWRMNHTEPAITYVGSEATEERFKQEAPGKRVLHLATHGFYLSDECRPKVVGKQEGFVGENPFLQCGFLLAGANQHSKASAGQEDGIVTAEEVAGLNLQGTDLVVLSACETGLGEIKSGEGVYGLRRAFQMAGARTVISALWQVDDKSTADLMGTLFSNADSSLPVAMQRAALQRLAELRQNGNSDHPFYWAGFVATGDWLQNR